MSSFVTLREQKSAERERRFQAVEALKGDLSAYARAHGGRFLLYGSAARGHMRHNSDIDILLDFPKDATDDAWVFAEDACRRHRLSPDIRPRSWCGPAFLDHIDRDIEVVG